jgi:hypothetical protein
MKRTIFAITILLAGFAVSNPSYAAACVNGVYRAGCTGPNGTAVVRKAPAAAYRAPVYHAPVHCASGPYRAGCAGPNGAAVARRPY